MNLTINPAEIHDCISINRYKMNNDLEYAFREKKKCRKIYTKMKWNKIQSSPLNLIISLMVKIRKKSEKVAGKP